MPDIEILQLTAIGIIFVFAIKEFFAYLRVKKSPNGTSKDILKELQLINENHLNDITKRIDVGNQNVVNAINTMNKDLGDKLNNVNAGIVRLIGRGDLK
jgi:hypothetical protein